MGKADEDELVELEALSPWIPLYRSKPAVRYGNDYYSFSDTARADSVTPAGVCRPLRKRRFPTIIPPSLAYVAVRCAQEAL